MKLAITNILTHVVDCSTEEAMWLNDYLSMVDERQQFYRDARGQVRRRDDGGAKLRLLNTVTKTFPAGMTRSVLAAGRAAGHQVLIADKRVRPCDPDPTVDIGWLYDFQGPEGVVGACWKRTRGIVKSPTGSGKTEMMVALVKSVPCRWLLLVDDKDLVHNAARRFEKRTGEQAGLAGDGQWDVDHRFVCATFQTIAKRLRDPDTIAETRAWLESIEGVLVDECFPAGTTVGDVPIETLGEGDVVPSWVNGPCRRRVVRTFKSRPKAMVRLHFDDGRSIATTPGHPFLTEDGWTPAYSLCGSCVVQSKDGKPTTRGPVQSMRSDPSTYVHASESGGLLRTVPCETTRGEKEGDRETVQPMRRGVGAQRSQGSGEGETRSDVLRRMPPNDSQGEREDEQRPRRVSSSDAEEQPIAPPGGAGEDLCDASQDRTPTAMDRWKGTSPHEASETPARSVEGGVGTRGRCYDERGERPPELHLHRRSEPRTDGCDRGGWGVSLHPEGPGCRPTQDRVPEVARVVRVEVLEPGSDGTFGGVCPDGHVYNIEVEGTHTYVVDGHVVHNCHSTSADTFYQVVTTIPAYWRFGFSGTPLDRADKMGIFTVGALGDIVYEVPTQLLIERKIIARPLITMHKLAVASAARTYQGAYSDIVVKSVKRNNLIADLVKDSPGPALVFVKTIKHGKDLAKRITKRGLRCEFIDGKASTEQRDQLVERVEWGDVDAVVVTKMWQKGKDIPSIGTVVNAAGHRSLIPVLQQMGRGMRVVRDSKGNIVKDEVVVHDVLDTDNKWLRRHGVARKKAYEAEGHQVELRDEAER